MVPGMRVLGTVSRGQNPVYFKALGAREGG
jgi:hypothetical protein